MIQACIHTPSERRLLMDLKRFIPVLKESKCTSMATVMEANQMIIKVTPHNYFVDAEKLIAKATTQAAIMNAIAHPDIRSRNVFSECCQRSR